MTNIAISPKLFGLFLCCTIFVGCDNSDLDRLFSDCATEQSFHGRWVSDGFFSNQTDLNLTVECDATLTSSNSSGGEAMSGSYTVKTDDYTDEKYVDISLTDGSAYPYGVISYNGCTVTDNYMYCNEQTWRRP